MAWEEGWSNDMTLSKYKTVDEIWRETVLDLHGLWHKSCYLVHTPSKHETFKQC